jgi:hypothetical protein
MELDGLYIDVLYIEVMPVSVKYVLTSIGRKTSN